MRFALGLHTDLFERIQPEGTYSDMQNGIFDLGHQLIQNEQGTTKLTLIPYTPIGSIILNDGTAVIFSRDLQYSWMTLLINSPATASADRNDTIVINGTDTTKTDVTVIVAILSGDTKVQQAIKYVAALMADATFLAEYRAEIDSNDSNGETVKIRTTNGTTDPNAYNTISVTVTDSLTEGNWIIGNFIDGSDTLIDSAIGTFDGSGYTAVYDDHGNISANRFNFAAGSYIEGTSRINADLDILIYWTDDVNVPRFANITNPISGSFDVHLVDLFPYTTEIPYFELDSVSIGGLLESGAYYIAAAYVDNDGTRTNYFIVSPPIFVNDESDLSDPDSFDGTEPNTKTSKSISFTFTGLDTSRDFVRLAVVKDSAVSLLPDVVMPSNGILSYTYTGSESVVERDLADVTVNRVIYDKAKTIRQIGGRIYLGNLKGRTDIGYQRYANNITLSGVQKNIDGHTNLNFKDPIVAIESRSFRRDEAYAFYITWVLTDGGESKAYHIPGREPLIDKKSNGSITFADAPSSKNASSGTITYSGGPPSKQYNHWIRVNGTDVGKTDVLVDVVAEPNEYDTPEALAGLATYLLNQDSLFAAEYVATSSGAVVTISTNPSVAVPTDYDGISITAEAGVGFGSVTVDLSGAVDSDTASFGAGPICQLDEDAGSEVTSADIFGQETGTSIATKMETAMNGGGAPWTDYVFTRIGATIHIEASANGPYNRLLSFLPNGCTAEAGPVTASLEGSYTKVITVTGGAGTLGIEIDAIDYTEAYAASPDATAAAWVVTHQATLLALGVFCEDTGAAEITLSSQATYTIVDTSVGGMAWDPSVDTTWFSNGLIGGGDYYDGNEYSTIYLLGADAEVVDLTTQDETLDPDRNIQLFRLSGYPDELRRMGYWENANETYPAGDDWKIYDVVDGVGVDTGASLAGSNVRHHRFPQHGVYGSDIKQVFQGTSASNDYQVQGFQLTNIKIPDELANKVKGFKIYYAERTYRNRTIIDSGLMLAAVVNEGEVVTNNRASDIATENLLSRQYMVCHPFKAMTERTNLAAVSYVKAVANVNPAALTDNRAGITIYSDPNGEVAAGLHTDGEPLVRTVKGRFYILPFIDELGIAGGGFDESLHKNGHGELKALFQTDDDMPEISVGAATTLNNYLMNLCIYKTDLYLSFMHQPLVWTGYWQENLEDLSSGPAGRQHAVNATPEIYGGDTFIGWQTHKVHAERFTKIVTVTDPSGSGTLGIDIDEGAGLIAYDEAWNTDADTTALLWVATHQAALAALQNPITANKSGTDEITLICNMPFTAVDGGVTMTATFTGSDGIASKFLNLTGGSGVLGIKIGDTIYTEPWNTNQATTAINWVATHVAALAAADNPIIATVAGLGIIKLASGISFKVEDKGGSPNLSFTIQESWSVLTHDFVAESDYNIGMRHQGDDPWENYYPKSERSDVITPPSYPDGIIVDEDVDNFWGYDPQFSALANVKYPIPFDGSEVSDELPTRVIRSAEDIGGADDTFREFLPTNFIDLPRNRGELIKLQAIGQILIPHMERGLLRTRGREQLDTSTISAFIGSGDIFAVSPDEIISTDPGYGGLQDQGASIVTEHGYFFVDRAAGKVFLLTDQLHEISAKGMQNFFEDNLDGGGVLSAAWDPELRRIMITKSGSSTIDFTLSFLPETKTWISHHDYQPLFYVSTLTKLNSYYLAYIHSHSSGNYGKFYETIQEFEISFVENIPLNVSKQVASLVIDTTSVDGVTENRKDTFNKVQIINSYQDTGLVTLVDYPASGWNIRRTKRTHKVNKLRDTLNVAPGSSDQFPAWALKKRMVDNYHIVRLLYSNTNSYLLRLFDAKLNLRSAKR